MSTTTTTDTNTTMIPFAQAVTRGRTALKSVTKAAWTLGDLAATVAPKYGDKTVQKLAEALDVEYKTLINYRTVAAAYAENERSADNRYGVHEVFAPLADRVELVASKVWTVRAARDLVKSRKTADGGTDATDAGTTDAAPAAPAVSEIDAARAHVAQLEGELIKARAHLAKLESAAPAPAAPSVHNVRGIPAHDVTSPRADCPQCQAVNHAQNVKPIRGSKNTPAAKPSAVAASAKVTAAKPAARKTNRTSRAASKNAPVLVSA